MSATRHRSTHLFPPADKRGREPSGNDWPRETLAELKRFLGQLEIDMTADLTEDAEVLSPR